jgi:two-component sensor histidine kinase
MKPLVATVLEPFRGGVQDPFDVSGPEVALPDVVFTGLALALHELATNAHKHGALSLPEGKVTLGWELDSGRLRILWREMGGPQVREPGKRSFGLTLITRGALPPPHEVDVDFRPDGLNATITVDLSI